MLPTFAFLAALLVLKVIPWPLAVRLMLAAVPFGVGMWIMIKGMKAVRAERFGPSDLEVAPPSDDPTGTGSNRGDFK